MAVIATYKKNDKASGRVFVGPRKQAVSPFPVTVSKLHHLFVLSVSKLYHLLSFQYSLQRGMKDTISHTVCRYDNVDGAFGFKKYMSEH